MDDGPLLPIDAAHGWTAPRELGGPCGHGARDESFATWMHGERDALPAPGSHRKCRRALDHISGGRFTLGLGAGWHEPESVAYGIPLGSLRERFDRLDEGVEIIVSMLNSSRTTFHGRYFEVTDAMCEPKPLQAKLPIVIGGAGPKRTLRTAARWADQWDMCSPWPEDWARANVVLLEHCEELGRSPSDIRRSVHIMWEPAADPAELANRAAAFGDVGVDLAIFSMRGPYEPRLLDPLADACPARSTWFVSPDRRPRCVLVYRHVHCCADHCCSTNGFHSSVG